MKHILKRILLVLLLLLAAGVVLLNVKGGLVIKKGVNLGGPVVMGVPVTLQDADLHLLRGYVRLEGLHVGNPEGFKTDGIFDLDRLDIDLDVKSLLTDTIHIRSIVIRAPAITYERGLTSSNLSKLMEQLGDSAEKKKPEESSAKSGRKVVIDEIVLESAKLNVSLTAAGGHSATLPLPPITLHDIGKEKGGASATEVIGEVLSAIAGSVTSVIAGAGKLLGEGAELVGDGAVAVGKGALKGAEAVGEGAAAVGGAAVDGAAAVGGAAVDGAKAVGEGAAVVGGAVVGGASKVVSGIGSLFGGDASNSEKQTEKKADDQAEEQADPPSGD